MLEKRERPFFLNYEDDQIIAKAFQDGTPFYAMDMEDDNIKDALLSISRNEMEAIVSEDHGGIIGYFFRGVGEEVATVLTLRHIHQEGEHDD